MPDALDLGGEERLGVALKARAAAVDEVRMCGVGIERPQVEAAGEDGLDRAVMRRAVGECARAGGFQSLIAVLFGQTHQTLHAAQALDDAVGEQILHDRRAARAHAPGLLEAPVAVVSKERPGLGRQVIQVGAPLAWATRAQVRGHQAVILEDRHRYVGCAQPQGLADQGEGRRVEAEGELHVAVPMQHHPVPGAQIGSHRRELVHQGSFDRKALERSLTGGAVDTKAGFLEHPAARLGVEIGEIAERAGGQEVALYVLHPRLDDPLLLRIGWRTTGRS